jgi:pyridoxine 5-phosphate synthase
MPGTKLSVNVNRVALLRNSRDWEYPSVVETARLALDAGAHGITVHPRPDERHIRARDVADIAELLREKKYVARGCEFNIEGNPFLGEFLNHCRRFKATQATFVPDSPDQRTSDHGFALDEVMIGRLRPLIAELRAQGTRVSLFMDADPQMIERAPATGADRIELYTEQYARAFANGGAELEASLERYQAAAAAAQTGGLGVNAGHDLTVANLSRFVKIPHILEVSIGHAVVADAVCVGMSAAVKAFLKALG